ncbi:unnamed protein product [Prorocentrum cordatum]|uniref:Uncharacterized protein n=1 Tax=Prorocentrum cordatum TaxID=2364126 RepID=A0ABN9WTL2_9DINO|nr:unnamed protein product [Polarella glacialis]
MAMPMPLAGGGAMQGAPPLPELPVPLPDWLTGNPYFTAGFGLGGIATVMGLLRQSSAGIQSVCRRQMLMTLEIPSKDFAYQWADVQQHSNCLDTTRVRYLAAVKKLHAIVIVDETGPPVAARKLVWPKLIDDQDLVLGGNTPPDWRTSAANAKLEQVDSKATGKGTPRPQQPA